MVLCTSISGRFEESLGQNPAHNATVMMKGAELRVDYMGSCILMATLSGFKSGLHDDWVLPQQDFHNFEGIFILLTICFRNRGTPFALIFYPSYKLITPNPLKCKHFLSHLISRQIPTLPATLVWQPSVQLSG